MKAKVITVLANKVSEDAAKQCIESGERHGLMITKEFGIVPSGVTNTMNEWGIRWNYPWNGEVHKDLASGLTKVGYQTKEPKKRIACFLSHYKLWKECVHTNEDILIFEHDAYIERPIDFSVIENSKKQIIGLNQPQAGATPRAQIYESKILSQINSSGPQIVDVPYVFEDQSKPAGLPGNSAYYLKPTGAKKLLNMVSLYGAWPNDAIMCRQLLPGIMGIYCPFISRVQITKSTTTL